MAGTPMTLQQAFDAAMRLHRQGRLREADHVYRQILAQDPNEPDALQLSGLVAHDEGRSADAITLIRRAVALAPGVAAYHNHLGIALRGAGQTEAAVDAYREALRLRPDYADAHYNLGNALQAMCRSDEAIARYRRALELKPGSANVYANLAKVFHDRGMWDEAIAAGEQVLRLAPGEPSAADAAANLGYALALQGRGDEALAAYRQAVELAPTDAQIHSRLIQTMLYHPATDGPAFLAECRRWNSRHAEPLKPWLPHANDRTIDRRLRIGYVSADFRNHACARYSEPLIAAHDRDRFEVFCYADVSRPDEVTERIRATASRWHNITGMSDESVAALVRADAIDVLVDLNLHTHGNRLLTFARKPAPVQVCWLGFPGTTGLDAIDCRLTDPHLDPPGEHDAWYAERSVRLDDTFWCYSSQDDDLPVAPPPALSRGHVTFGSMNSFCKVNDATLDLWAAALRAVEGSRLLILADEGSHRERTVRKLDSRGVAPDRVRFEPRRPRREYLALYAEIDVALDAFPYNGETTSLDGLWMGVPVVTMAGQTAVSRGGLSLLTNLGLGQWVARSGDEFATIARRLAADLPELQRLRHTLRSRLQASPLMDAPRFVRAVERAYRSMWRAWCESG